MCQCCFRHILFVVFLDETKSSSCRFRGFLVRILPTEKLSRSGARAQSLPLSGQSLGSLSWIKFVDDPRPLPMPLLLSPPLEKEGVRNTRSTSLFVHYPNRGPRFYRIVHSTATLQFVRSETDPCSSSYSSMIKLDCLYQLR